MCKNIKTDRASNKQQEASSNSNFLFRAGRDKALLKGGAGFLRQQKG